MALASWQRSSATRTCSQNGSKRWRAWLAASRWVCHAKQNVKILLLGHCFEKLEVSPGEGWVRGVLGGGRLLLVLMHWLCSRLLLICYAVLLASKGLLLQCSAVACLDSATHVSCQATIVCNSGAHDMLLVTSCPGLRVLLTYA